MSDAPGYEFYTDEGDAFAHRLIQLARVNAPLTPEQVVIERDAIQRQCAEAGYGEAYDTACRESIEYALEAPHEPPFILPDEDGDGRGYELVMPFIVTHSHGGPFDDEAYVCGYEMGHLDAVLDVVRGLQVGPPVLTIHRANMPQAELLAMKHRMTLMEIPWPDCDEPEYLAQWAPITFTYLP